MFESILYQIHSNQRYFKLQARMKQANHIFKIDTTTLGSEKLTSRIKDIEIQPLNEFIIKRNDDSATTPNVVNITDDIVHYKHQYLI